MRFVDRVLTPVMEASTGMVISVPRNLAHFVQSSVHSALARPASVIRTACVVELKAGT
jgi:hypothetical protein